MSKIDARDERDLGAFIPSTLDDYGLDPYEFRVYSHIARRAGSGECWESIDNIAECCKINVKTARKAIALLSLSGLIKQTPRQGKTNSIKLTHAKHWLNPDELDSIREKLTPTKSGTTSSGTPPLPSGGTPPLPSGGTPPLPSGGTPPLPSGGTPPLPDQVPKGTPIKVPQEGTPKKVLEKERQNDCRSQLGLVVALPSQPEPEASINQLALAEVQSTPPGEERSTSTEGTNIPPAISPAKKFEAFKERFKATYNQHKPDSFARIDVLNEPRCKSIKRFLKDLGDNEESALLTLSNALDYAASDPWWCSKNMSFENFSSNGKILQLHEKQVSRGLNGFRFTTEREAKMAQTYNRYAGYMANRSLDHAS